MKDRRGLFLAQNFVKSRRLAFTDVLGHRFHFTAKDSLTELNFNDVAEFQLIGGLYDFSVYQNVTVGAGVVGNGASFDNARIF